MVQEQQHLTLVAIAGITGREEGAWEVGKRGMEGGWEGRGR